MNLNKIKKIHFIGIGGIGISAIAKMMLLIKKQVSGSDLLKTEITENLKKMGAKVYYFHHLNNICKDIDLVIYSSAVPDDNQEKVKTKKLKIPLLSYGEFLGKLSADKKTIAVTGTNGKTTTSAILGKVFIDCGLAPTVIIGSLLKQFNGNFYQGQSNYLTIEADEYKATMLKIKPWSIILTSIEEDHLDFYKDLADIKNHFQKFIDKLPPNGFLFYNADDANITTLNFLKNSFACSLKGKNDYWAKDIIINNGSYTFNVNYQNEKLGEFNLKIPGEYNILNSLMVIGLCHQLKIDLTKVKQSLASFNGLWRRFEIVGELKNVKNVTVISDYTHHPSAIIKTLKAAKEFYPDKRLFLVYQPHQHHRTKKLFNQFLTCFNQADFIILNEIYDVAGRKYRDDQNISSNDLVKKINKPKIIYSANFISTKELIYKHVKQNDLLLIMGAGDIDNLARNLVK